MDQSKLERLLQELASLFPTELSPETLDQLPSSLAALRELLLKNAEPRVRSRAQQLFCRTLFRCPHGPAQQAYARLAGELGLSFKEPEASIYFTNKQLPNISNYSEHLAKEEYPESHSMRGVTPKRLLLQLEKIFQVHGGQVPYAEQVLIWFPRLLILTTELNFHMLYEDSALPKVDKLYLALLTAGSQDCDYLFCRLTQEYDRVGGSKDWLEGLACAPPKFKAMAHLIKVLGERPWALQQEAVLDDILGKALFSKSQLAEAVVIVCFYLALSSFCLGMGLVPDVRPDFEFLPTLERCSSDKSVKADHASKANLVKLLKEEHLDEFLPEKHEHEALDEGLDHSVQQLLKAYKPDPRFARFKSELPLRKGLAKQELLSDLYNFKEHSFALLQHFCPDTVGKLSLVLEEAKRMTNKRVGDESNLNTAPFRRAIRYYNELREGFRHEYFNYEGMLKLLDPQLRLLINVVGGRPYLMNRSVAAPAKLGALDYAHMCLLIAESRLELTLNMACRHLAALAFT